MTYYHLADEVNFQLDPDFRPQNNTTMGGDYRPGIFVSGDPYGVSHWCQMYGYWRPWVVEFEGSVRGVEGGYGNEVFIPAEHFDKLRVSRVVPLDAFCRELYQDWGWTEDHYETTFDTEEPIAPLPGGWGRLETPEWKGSYRYPGDARSASSSWRSQYEARIRRYQGEVGGIVSNRRTAETIQYQRNNNGMRGIEGFGQDIEPWGKYMILDAPRELPAGWERGEVTFNNPLRIDYADGGWKQELVDRYGTTGKELSQALIADGYDGIITEDKYGVAEIVDIRTAQRTAGTRTDPGGVYRGINVQVLSHDEQEEVAAWANGNSFSMDDYQLAEPNYELVYRILDRLDSGGLGRHWSKDYDVSADFARDQGDGIELILIGHWEGEGVDTREFHRGWDGVQRPSNIPHEEEVTLYPGTPVTLVGMDIVTETGFTYNIPVPNIQVTAGHDMKHLANRTATNDLRVHLFDSEGHEMFLEPDFEGSPWTWHPKVMEAVRFLADVAQSNGVYWHMDHNEWIPSKITDFKVFDGPNDVTHEIKEFPQLRGHYASRTAYVSDDIYESYYDTDRLVALAMNAYTWDGDGPLWELVANSPEEAQAFFDSLDEDERRTNVAEVFENGGWDLSGIGHKFATRTAASTPSAPGILYRGIGLPLSEAQWEDVAEYQGTPSFANKILSYMTQGFFGIGSGSHWTTEFEVAKSFSQGGTGIPVVLVVDWDGQGEDVNDRVINNFGGEAEVTLLPGTKVKIVDLLYGPSLESIIPNGHSLKGWSIEASRTAAEPGGVLPWTPSHRGYYWITKTDGTLEAVTNDGVNRMFLTEEPWGWEWEVYDSLGFVEGGTFGMALKGGDALRDRANDLLAEFDTRAERRTRGPSWGYQDDYTQAPNTLWSKREAWSNSPWADYDFENPTYAPYGPMTLYRGFSFEANPGVADQFLERLKAGEPVVKVFEDALIESRYSAMQFGDRVGVYWSTDKDYALNLAMVDSFLDDHVGLYIQAHWEGGDHDINFGKSDRKNYWGNESEVRLLPGTEVKGLEVGIHVGGRWHTSGTGQSFTAERTSPSSGRKTTSERYAERLRREGRR